MKLHIQHCFLIYILESFYISVVNSTCKLTPQVNFPDGKREKSQIEGLVVVNTTSETAIRCFGKCVENCQCKSINVCGKTCQLNSGNQENKALSDNADCSYYELSWKTQNSGTTSGSCTQKQSCCSTGNPCLNGGTCIEQCPTSSTKRYRCICPQHLAIKGEHCEIGPKSCRTIYDANPGSQSGVYTLFNNFNQSFPAYCDFNLHDGKVWTLVQSFSLGNILPHYQKKQLFVDNPRNVENPDNWQDYRLSKARFNSIQKNSTHFRMTCNYDSQSIEDMVDYVRLKTSVVDFLTYNIDNTDQKCILVEYLNIRGGSCADCTLAMVQTSTWNIFTSPNRNALYSCDWQYPNGHPECEENLGGYECWNTEYRCTSSSSSTTNTWYGS
ncbi:uncharacterized protein LOC114528967 [Dendronephthya gigantea]|uniref:uncharacterized protein LOC114528967 n=1 Tax=Dendronephthya gigantea TaxID=151771 RepID=UPI00106CD896|nr:uncharacterized protein LOC114528967 [Dendronephthya gigantea]